jgi:hypothetical protein
MDAEGSLCVGSGTKCTCLDAWYESGRMRQSIEHTNFRGVSPVFFMHYTPLL